ncbi:MAG: F390 synthetase-related protein [Pseudomonadota bacterium]
MFERVSIAWHFIRARYLLDFRSRARLEAWQQRRLRWFLHNQLPRAPYYRSRVNVRLQDLPIVDKAVVMANFSGMNTRGILLDQAMSTALMAEETRDFTPVVDGVTIGLSSGTSGNRGLFMANAGERSMWAGIVLARVLPRSMVWQILAFWRPPLRVAFFLRANSNVYATLSSRRLEFRFHDLLAGLQPALPDLERQQPDVLVAPANVLKCIAGLVATGQLSLCPRHIISVAEVLEPDDAREIMQVFGLPVHQIYQATEGFLGYTCEQGTLHLNEAFVHMEPEWLDEARTRFQPVLTDFTRTTQMLARYRLNDVLRVADRPCVCGRADRAIAAIEGRSDDVMWLPHRTAGVLAPVFPDLIRGVMLLAAGHVRDYRAIQTDMSLRMELDTDESCARQRISDELGKLWMRCEVLPPTLVFADWTLTSQASKRRRIRCVSVPVVHATITPEACPC